MSPQRRRLLAVVAAVVVVALAAVILNRLPQRTSRPLIDQSAVGPVLLIPGYGGTTEELKPLAASIRATGREAVVVDLPSAGTGDLRVAAKAIADVAAAALASGAPSVDLVGYSAGGVLARLYAATPGARVRRAVTLGTPHHGTKTAAAAAAFAPAECTVACEQLVPGSSLLRRLPETPGGTTWVSVWSADDEVVTPPDSARLRGATNLVVQQLCPGIHLSHGGLPTAPEVIRIVLEELRAGPVAQPEAC